MKFSKTYNFWCNIDNICEQQLVFVNVKISRQQCITVAKSHDLQYFEHVCAHFLFTFISNEFSVIFLVIENQLGKFLNRIRYRSFSLIDLYCIESFYLFFLWDHPLNIVISYHVHIIKARLRSIFFRINLTNSIFDFRKESNFK